ncbi:MAG: LLM class F420-dependent oxidoreductase [Candidatus Binataceae bacterium]
MSVKYPIRFGVQTGQQNVGWDPLVELWSKADSWGYDSLWVFDHFYPIFVPDPTGPCMEGWTLLSALSQHTKRARLGALVNGNTYRNPCVTAKMAATLDNISGGRFNLGIGAGWFEMEHRSFGIDFKTIPGRLQALNESLQIIKGMFTQEKTSLDGRHYKVVDAVCNPKPLSKPHPPIMVGGQGEKTLLKLVARHADMWNSTGDAERMRHLIGVINRHCDIEGRNPDDIEKTVAMGLVYDAPKERQQAMMAIVGAMSGKSPEDARKQIMIGGKVECMDTIERYTKAGVTHFIFMALAPYFPEDFQRFAEDVMPAFRS